MSLAFGVPLAWLVERTDLPGKTAVFTLMTVGLLLPGFASAMGWLFLMHPRIGMRQYCASCARSACRGRSFNIATSRGHGLGPGPEPRARRLHHDGRGVPRHGPGARGGGADRGRGLRRTLAASPCALAWPGILAAAIYIFTIGFAAFDVPAIIGWGARLSRSRHISCCSSIRRGGCRNMDWRRRCRASWSRSASCLSWWYSRIQRRAAPLPGRHRQGLSPAHRGARALRQSPAWGFRRRSISC